jgi:hypothetical protein
MTTPTLAYITPRSSGYQVRLPRRVGGSTKFFLIPSGPGSIAGQQVALRSACRWRDKKFEAAGLPLTTRVANHPDAGINLVVDRNGVHFAAATWQYGDKQMKRMFSIDRYGGELAYLMAHMARDFGVLAEADRQLEELDGHPFPQT